MPAARRPHAGSRAGRGRGAGRPGPVHGVLERGVARVPRVRAHGHHRDERLPGAGMRFLPGPAGRPGPGGPGHDLGGRPRSRRRGGRTPGLASALRTGGWRTGGGRGGGGRRVPRLRHPGHGGHQHRRLPRAGRRSRARCPTHGRGPARSAAVTGHPHHRRGRRLHRPHRPRRSAARRAPLGRRRSRPRLLWPRRFGGHGHRRRPGRGPHPPRRRVSRARPSRLGRSPGRAGAGRRHRRRRDRGGRRVHDPGRAGRLRAAGGRPPRPRPRRMCSS